VTRTRLSWAIGGAVAVLAVAGAVDAVHSSEANAPRTLPRPATRETTSAAGTSEALPRCTAQNIGVAVDVLGGSATVVVRHVWGRPCHLVALPVRLSVTDRRGKRARLETNGSPSERAVDGDFAPGFERLIDIPYLANCDRRGPFTAFITVGAYSAQRRLSAGEVGCFRGR
jgi:hypothetical protein